MKCITIFSMNPMYGREKIFSRSTLYYNAKFPYKCLHKQSLIKWQCSMCLFQILQQSLKFDVSMFSKRQKQFLEKKTYCSLSKKNSHYSNERAKNQIIKNQAIKIQSTLSMKEKTKSKPISLLNAKGKMFFKPTSKWEIPNT